MIQIKQTTDYNCGVACLSMVTGDLIETIEYEIYRNCDGMRGLYIEELQYYLFNRGIICYLYQSECLFDQNMHKQYLDIRGNGRMYYPNINMVQNYSRTGTLIINTLSKCDLSEYHFIVVRGGQIYDPCPDEDLCYKTGDHVIITECLLI